MTKPPVLRRGQLVRLLQIVVALQSGRRPNARGLAALCEVSRRTIFRDLDAIEQAGLPVEYDPIREGYRIGGGAGLVPPALHEREVLALIVLAGRATRLGMADLADEARGGVAKLIQAATGGMRERLEVALLDQGNGPGDSPARFG